MRMKGKPMDSIGIAVIGYGGMGRKNVRDITTCDPRLKVLAVHDPDERSRAKAREDFPEAVIVADDFHEVLQVSGVQWVVIASWNSAHSEQTVAAFEAGLHVFCQKPLALNTDECLRMLRAWKRSGCYFNIGFTLRYSPHYRRIRELVAGGRIGQIVSMEFNETLDFNHGGYIMGDWRRLRRHAGTHLLEKCCHDIDLANWIIASRAARVASFGGLNFFKPENAGHRERLGSDAKGKQGYGSWGGLIDLDPFTADKDIVDNQVAIIEYANAVRATFHTNCNAGIPERRMYILGTEGAIRADVLTGSIQLKRIGFGTALEDVSTTSSGGHGGGDEILGREVADTMLDGRPPSAGLIEGLNAAVTCFGIDAAMDSGQVVDMAPLWERVDAALAGAE